MKRLKNIPAQDHPMRQLAVRLTAHSMHGGICGYWQSPFVVLAMDAPNDRHSINSSAPPSFDTSRSHGYFVSPKGNNAFFKLRLSEKMQHMAVTEGAFRPSNVLA